MLAGGMFASDLRNRIISCKKENLMKIHVYKIFLYIRVIICQFRKKMKQNRDHGLGHDRLEKLRSDD